MGTKIRMTKSDALDRFDPMFMALATTGKSEITLWEFNYTGASSGSETEIDAPDNDFDGSVPLAAEITCKTRANSIGGEYLTWIEDDGDGTTTTRYFWWSKAEITEVTCLAKADCTGETTFHFYVDDGAGGEDHYYVWINKSVTDSDPSETGTAIEADISGDTTATNVAATVAAAINAKGNVSASNTDEVVTITNANNGNVTDCGDGEGDATGFSFSIEQGGDDPSATGTGTEVDISSDTTATNVADALASAMNGIGNMTATHSSEVVTAENDNHTADITDPTDSGSFASSINVLNSGTGEYSGGYLYVVSGSSDDDDTATSHCQKVTVIGFDDSGDPISEEVSMNGTSYVKTSNKFSRVIHMYGSDFGSGGSDAAGAITLVDAETGNGTTYLTIAQNGTESNGFNMWCPNSNYLALYNNRIANITNANTGTTLVRVEFSGFEDAENTDSDFDSRYYIASQYNTESVAERSLIPRIGTNTACVTMYEREMGTTGNETFVFIIRFITWQ